jgi:hypothetical protein
MIGVALAEWLCASKLTPVVGASTPDIGRGPDAVVSADLGQHLPDRLGNPVGGEAKEFE